VSFTTPKTWAFGEVLTATDMNTYVRDNTAALLELIEGIPVLQKRVARFTGSGTWTVPAGVTFAIAHMLGGGGGGGGSGNAGGNGGVSSVDFASGLVSSNGGRGGASVAAISTKSNEVANSGRGGGSTGTTGLGSDSQWIVAGAAVTPAASISVVVGSGGTAGTSGFGVGGSGYVWIEYFVEV
jgi:hypothetical protein